jgi:hypothetical protein
VVPALAFAATAIASLFAEATLVRYTARRTPQLGVWAVALGMFALASAALALGVSTGWDRATFRVFFLLGAVLNVPWLALGTVTLVLGQDVARRARWFLVFFSGLGTGVLLSAPMDKVAGTAIPVGKDVFDAFPRALAAIGSGVGAIVILAGALWSVARLARDRDNPAARGLALGNGLIALGTLVLSSGGVVQGVVGDDEAFTLTLVMGIAVIYAGFLVVEGRRVPQTERKDQPRSSRRSTLPARVRGS